MRGAARFRQRPPRRVAFLFVLLLLGLGSCGEELLRPRPDPALAAAAFDAVDFTTAKTGLLAPRHEYTLDGRRYRLVVHEERVQSPLDPSRLVVRCRLGACLVSSSGDVHWFDRGFELPVEAAYPQFDAARFEAGVIVVASAAQGLVEYRLTAREDGSIEAPRRTLTGPASRAPLVVCAGEDLLLLRAEFSTASRRTFQGGQHLIVSRRRRGSVEWEDTTTLTLDLAGPAVNQRAVCVRGDRVGVAWGENRFAADGPGWGADFRRTNKLCVATSADRGVTWSPPALLHDPEDEHTSTGQGLAIFDDGKRLVVVCKEAPMWESEAGRVGETLVLASDLRTWFPDRSVGWDDVVRLADGKH